MHETHLIKNILKYLEEEERVSSRRVRKIYIALSEFGGISREHFLEHYRQESLGSRWNNLDIEFKKRIFGPELEITRIDFNPLN